MPSMLKKVPMTPPATAPTATPEPSSLLEPEYQAPYAAWKAAPGPKTMGALLEAVKSVREAGLRTNAPNSSPTMKTHAKLNNAEAIAKYDPMRGKLKTHLMYHMQGLHRANAQENQIIRLPERVGIDSYHLRQHEADLRDELGRSPSMAELSDRSGLSSRRIQHIRKAQPGMPEGMLATQGEAGDEQPSAGPAVQQSDSDRIWHEFVYNDLQPTDQVIMEHTLGLYGHPVLPKKEIARKLNISPGAVTQRAAKIQAQLDKQEELSPLM